MSNARANNTTEGPNKPRWSFRLKLTILAVSVALIPVAIVGLIAMNVNKTALSQANQELLYSVLDHIVRHAEDKLEKDRQQLGVAASALMDSEQSLDAKLALLKALVGGGGLPLIAVYDQEGKWIDTVKPEDKSTLPTMPKKLSAALTADALKESFAQGSLAELSNQDEFRLLLVRPAKGEETWFVASYFQISNLQDEIESVGHERLGQGHSLVLVDTGLQVLADSQIESRGQILSEERMGILKGVDANAIDEGILLFGESSSSDRSMLGAIRSLPNVPWAVVAEIPRDIAFHSIAKIRWILWVVVAIAGILALIIGIVTARKISAPLQLLVNFAGDLANRRFDKRIDVRTRDELSILGQALSSAAIELEASDQRIRKEERIRSDLGRYLPGGLVDRIVEEKQDLNLGGNRCEITVLFADVVGFTPLAESHSADEVVRLLNDLFTILTEIVFRYEGTVDKFIGDSVMAFWGAPNTQENHAELALRAAEDMLRWLEIGNEGWKEKYGVEIRLAIGVNTGEAVVGNFGSKERMEYTSIGDCVNVAARLEAIARPQQILLTQATKEAAGDEFEFASLGSRQVVGRSAPIELFEVIL